MELLISLGIAILIFVGMVIVCTIASWLMENIPEMTAGIGFIITIVILTTIVYSIIKG